MILPIITNVSREVFLQVPRMNEEAALALGATRWEVIRMSVLPFGRSGVISASMLGLGRALGETMAVATVLSPSFLITCHLLDPGGGTFAQNIAAKFDEANEFGRDALIASGLVLFVITLLVNGAARADHRPPQGVLGGQRMSHTLLQDKPHVAGAAARRHPRPAGACPAGPRSASRVARSRARRRHRHRAPAGRAASSGA